MQNHVWWIIMEKYFHIFHETLLIYYYGRRTIQGPDKTENMHPFVLYKIIFWAIDGRFLSNSDD